MAPWRCPHCRTLQAASTRCFLCGRSATSCGTCINFRNSLVGGLGYCALDRKREPLSGEEQRACWTGSAALAGDGLFTANAATVRPPDERLVELKPLPAAGRTRSADNDRLVLP